MKKLLIEEEIKQIALDDEISAYEELYHLLFPSLFSIAFNIAHNKETAEEIVSDVFLKVWHSRKKLANIEEPQVYIFKMTRNQALTEIARQSKKRTIDILSINEEAFLRLENPEEKLISSDLQIKLNTAIQQLPPQCQLIFQLIKEEGLRYKEVAGILNLSVNTVRNQLAIAVKKLYEQLLEK